MPLINVGGVTLSLHPLFVIVMLLSIATGRFFELSLLFLIVLVHEFGHVWAARLAGATVRTVQLLPFGGVAVIEDRGRLSAQAEIAIAAAGPLQNVWMIAVAMLLKQLGAFDEAFLDYFIYANSIIALFNLLPVPPLDGGKIVQALASCMAPYYSALLWSGRAGIAASVAVMGYSLLPLLQGGGIRLNLLLIGSFLLYSNWTDHRNLPYRFLAFLMNRDTVYERYRSKGVSARPIVAPLAKPLDDILRLFKRNQYHFIYVLNNSGNVVAVVPEQRLVSSYFEIRNE